MIRSATSESTVELVPWSIFGSRIWIFFFFSCKQQKPTLAKWNLLEELSEFLESWVPQLGQRIGTKLISRIRKQVALDGREARCYCCEGLAAVTFCQLVTVLIPMLHWFKVSKRSKYPILHHRLNTPLPAISPPLQPFVPIRERSHFLQKWHTIKDSQKRDWGAK